MKDDGRITGLITRRKIYEFIVNYVNLHGYSPTIREIREGTDLKSTSSVAYHLKKLRDQKKIDYIDGKFRTIAVLNGK